MIANLLVRLVALIHFYIVALEMFLWDKPYGRKVFGNKAEFAAASKVLAANQGLYNCFLVGGLIWGLSMGLAGQPVQLFFLGCVIVAGLCGALMVGIKMPVRTGSAGGTRGRRHPAEDVTQNTACPISGKHGFPWRGAFARLS